jgi:hypothetical protein
MAIGNLKINYKTQKQNLDQSTRPQTKHIHPQHMYLKFSTTLTPSVEKVVIFMDSS